MRDNEKGQETESAVAVRVCVCGRRQTGEETKERKVICLTLHAYVYASCLHSTTARRRIWRLYGISFAYKTLTHIWRYDATTVNQLSRRSAAAKVAAKEGDRDVYYVCRWSDKYINHYYYY